MQFSKWTMGVGMLLGTLLPVSAEAQVVKNDKLLSFEDPQIPVFISGTDSRLEISDEHYKDKANNNTGNNFFISLVNVTLEMMLFHAG